MSTLRRRYKTYAKVEHATWHTASGQILQPSGGNAVEEGGVQGPKKVPICSVSSHVPASPGTRWVGSTSPLPFLSGNKLDTLE